MTKHTTEAGMLAERCEAASGPDRELDEAIATALGWAAIPNPTFAGGLVGRWTRPDGTMSGMEGPPQWTASIDAALTLVPAWACPHLRHDPDAMRPFCQLENGIGLPFPAYKAHAATYALAICAAALRARAAQ
jgi:hypothetical protein